MWAARVRWVFATAEVARIAVTANAVIKVPHDTKSSVEKNFGCIRFGDKGQGSRLCQPHHREFPVRSGGRKPRRVGHNLLLRLSVNASLKLAENQRFEIVGFLALSGRILWFDPRREYSSIPTANSRSRRAQGLSRLAASSRLRGHPQGLALIGPSTVASWRRSPHRREIQTVGFG
jgi:hypothetical protein